MRINRATEVLEAVVEFRKVSEGVYRLPPPTCFLHLLHHQRLVLEHLALHRLVLHAHLQDLLDLFLFRFDLLLLDHGGAASLLLLLFP